jgi:hypothetical protein
MRHGDRSYSKRRHKGKKISPGKGHPYKGTKHQNLVFRTAMLLEIRKRNQSQVKHKAQRNGLNQDDRKSEGREDGDRGRCSVRSFFLLLPQNFPKDKIPKLTPQQLKQPQKFTKKIGGVVRKFHTQFSHKISV